MDSIVLDSERRLRVSTADARAALVRFLRVNEFVITAEQVSMVTAKRGSQIVGSVQQKKLPVSFRATLMPAGPGCTVAIHLGDAWRSGVGKVWGMNGPYRSMMAGLMADLDAALAPLAAEGESFDAGVMTTATRDVPLLSQANHGVVAGGGAVANKVDQLITPGDVHATSKKLEEIQLRSSKGTASFDRMEVEGLFTVGLLVSTKPGAMPPNLARDVEALSAKLEAKVAAQPEGRVVCDLTDAEIPVAEFLGKQATLRETLPLRTLHVCTTCKFEKIVNPDYEKLQEKNRRKRILTGAVGATVTTSGISPFLLIGSLFKFKNFDIPFVCPRCQGLEADSSIVTYCPNCGERRDEAVLRTCRRCKHNFGAAHTHDGEFWGPHQAELAPPTVALPTVAPAGGSALPPPMPLAPPTLAPPTAGNRVAPAAAVLAPPSAEEVNRPSAPKAAVAATPAGWYADTTGRHEHRYWDGTAWTSHVSDRGVPTQDPV